MAGGYLGKISAVISANTGDYVRGLNEGAKATRDFAKTVQSTLNRSASEAAKAFEGIYTPLQQFERAIRQAGQLRLNFKGFEGAVRNINDLQKRLNGVLTNNEIDLVVRTSGLRDIEAVRQAINSLSEKEITLSANAGGLPGLLKARAELERSGAGATTIINTKATQAELDALIEKLNVLDDRKIDLIIDVVNQRGLEEAITRARRLQDVATQIAAPLAVTSAEFAKLSQSAQGQFAPALGAAQRAVEQFKADIDQLGPAGRRAFQELKADVDLVRASISRLSEVQSLTGGLFTGRELTFVNPEIVDTLNRLQAAQRQLASAPAAVRGSPIGQEVVADAQVLQEQLNRVLARVERIRAEGGQITFSQRGLNVILQRLQQVADETQRVSAGPTGFTSQPVTQAGGGLGLFGREAGTEVQRAVARAREASQEFAQLPDFASASLRGLASIAARVADGVEAGTSNAADLEAVLDRLIPRIRQAAAASEGVVFGPPAPPAPPPVPPGIPRDQPSLPGAFGGDARAGVGRDAGDIARQIENLTGRASSLKSTFDTLPAGLRAGLIPQIQAADDALIRLKASASQTDGDVASIAAQFAAVERAVSRAASAAQRFGGSFADFRAERDARAAAAGLEFLRTQLLRATGDSTRAAAAIDRLGEALQEAANTPGGFQANRIGIQSLTREAITLIAATEGVGRSAGSLQRGFARVGDVARGAFGNAGLAIQQAAFAFEDFFSVTGGLDQRIRAAGNNLSQLGFIIGGTTGLIAGISAAIGAQLVAAIIRWTGATQDAEEQQRALERSLEGVNSALERQRDIARQVADAFRDIAQSQQESVQSDGRRRATDRRQQLEEFGRLQASGRRERILATDPAAIRAGAEIAGIDDQLRTEADANRRRQLLRQREAAERRRELAVRTVDEQAAANASAQGGTPLQRDAALRRFEAAKVQVESQLSAAEQRNADSPSARAAAEVERLARQLSVVTATISRLQEAGRAGALTQGQRIADSAGRTFGNLAGTPGVSLIEATVARLQESLETARQQFADGFIDQGGFDLQANQIESVINQLEAASVAVSSFSQAVERAATSLADTVAQELSQRAESLRRDANDVEARFGGDDPRTAVARTDQRRIEEARRQAEERRAALNEETSRLRRQLEEQAGMGQLGGREGEIVGRIREIDQFLASPAGNATQARQQEVARLERERLNSELDSLISQRPEIQGLSRRADEGDIAARREINAIESAGRGRALIQTSAQRAAEELAGQIADIQSAVAADTARALSEGRFGDIAEIQGQGRSAESRLRDDAERQRQELIRQSAPAIFSLADSVQNAILQGPSRAALAPTDVSTIEGSRELTRLLRGDDAARNQDLVQLQRQSVELLRVIANNPAPVAN